MNYTKAIHKGVWINHELKAYCEPFNQDYDYSGKMTSTSDEMVTCSDCKKLVALQAQLVEAVTV